MPRGAPRATIGMVAAVVDESQPLRSLDARLEQRVELLSEMARALPELSPERREEERRRVLRFLRGEVAEHMAADERLLYPAVARRLHDPLAPALMRYDRRAIQWWIDEIARADLADPCDLQRLLYGVYAVLKVHLSREQDLYLGALEPDPWPR